MFPSLSPGLVGSSSQEVSMAAGDKLHTLVGTSWNTFGKDLFSKPGWAQFGVISFGITSDTMSM